MPHRIAIVENKQGLLSRLVETMGHFDGFSLVATHSNARVALRSLPESLPDIVLMDIRTGPVDGIACVARLKPRMPQTKFIVFAACDDSERVFQALAAGASGYLLQSATSGELQSALREVMAGGVPLDSDVARKIIQSFRVHSGSARGGGGEVSACGKYSPFCLKACYTRKSPMNWASAIPP